jgi:hypothetical protein
MMDIRLLTSLGLMRLLHEGSTPEGWIAEDHEWDHSRWAMSKTGELVAAAMGLYLVPREQIEEKWGMWLVPSTLEVGHEGPERQRDDQADDPSDQ